MYKMMKYMVGKEIKLFAAGLLINVLLGAGIRLNLLKDIGPVTQELVLGLYVFVLAIFLIERLTWYIEQGMIFDNREYLLSIPVPVNKILNSIGLIAVMEFTIWYGVMNIFMGNTFRYIVRDFTFFLPIILALIFVGSYLLSLTSHITRNRWNGNFAFAGAIATVVILYFVLYNVFNIRIPFLYSTRVGLVSLCILGIGIAYYGLCRKNALKENKLFYQMCALSIVVFSMIIYGLGQNYVYANRRVDEMPKEFSVNQEVLGKWYLVGIDYAAATIEAVDINQYGTHHVDMNAHYQLEFYEDGSTNYQLSWTDHYLYDAKNLVNQKYKLISAKDKNYLIVEWKDKDYIYNKGKVIYYVYIRI